MTDQTDTEAVQAAIDASVIYQTPAFPVIAASHAEFVDWARANGMDGRLVDFLAQRDDCAGATPAQWQRLSALGRTGQYLDLRDDLRREITISTVGQEAFDAYFAWTLARTKAEAEAA